MSSKYEFPAPIRPDGRRFFMKLGQVLDLRFELIGVPDPRVSVPALLALEDGLARAKFRMANPARVFIWGGSEPVEVWLLPEKMTAPMPNPEPLIGLASEQVSVPVEAPTLARKKPRSPRRSR